MNNPLVRSAQRGLDAVDKKISYSIFSRCQSLMPRLKPFLLALEWSCNGLIWIGMTVFLIVCNQEQTSMLPKLLIGLMTDVIYVAIIKALARRRRPTYAYQRDQMIVASIDKHSFPSGHCSRATYVALFASRYYAASSPFFTFLITFWSINVCVSRVLLGRHHVFDCIAGAALGWLNYRIQFHSFIPINTIFMFFIRSVFGTKAFNDTNDIDSTDPLD